MIEFFDTEDDKWDWLKKYKRDDIFLIQSCYNAKWAQDLNFILSKIMPTEPLITKEGKSLISGTMSVNINKKLYAYNCLNNKDYKKADKVFLVSGDNQFEDIFMKKKVYGIWHSSAFIHEKVGLINNAKQEWEIYVYKGSEKVFVASDSFGNMIKQNSMKYMNNKRGIETVTIGLPVIDDPQEPSLKNEILFNHRINADKHPEYLMEFPNDLKKHIIISAPRRTMSVKNSYSDRLEEMFGKNIRIFYNKFNKVHKYKELINRCGFGVSFSDKETFGYAIIEGIMGGLCYFVLKRDNSATNEYMINELSFDNLTQLYDMIRYYSKEENFNKRIEIVKRQQNIIYERYNLKLWIENLIKELQ